MKSESLVYQNPKLTSYTFVKYPYSKRFDLIYSNELSCINMMEDLRFTGIFDKDKETIYEMGWPLRYILDIKWDNNPFLELCDFIPDFLEKTNNIINEYIEKYPKEFSDNIKNYKGNLYKYEVEKAFVKGINQFENKVDLSMASNADVLNYLDDNGYCYDYAMRYLREHKEYIGTMIKDNELKNNYLSTIKGDINNPLHKAREMYKILKDSNAKNVHVFINKEGIDFDFKYDKKDLMYGCTSSYMSIFNMPASDRKNYANLFGENNDLTYKNIYKIEYKRKPLYIDNSFLNLSKDDDGYSI